MKTIQSVPDLSLLRKTSLSTASKSGTPQPVDDLSSFHNQDQVNSGSSWAARTPTRTSIPAPISTPPLDMSKVTIKRAGRSPPKTPTRAPRRASQLLRDETPCPPSRARAMMGAYEECHEKLKSELQRTLSPIKPSSPFLTKYSNLRNYAAWDVDGRLGNIEQQFDQLKSIIGDATSDREALGSAVEMYKSRGKEIFHPALKSTSCSLDGSQV